RRGGLRRRDRRAAAGARGLAGAHARADPARRRRHGAGVHLLALPRRPRLFPARPRARRHRRPRGRLTLPSPKKMPVPLGHRHSAFSVGLAARPRTGALAPTTAYSCPKPLPVPRSRPADPVPPALFPDRPERTRIVTRRKGRANAGTPRRNGPPVD